MFLRFLRTYWWVVGLAAVALVAGGVYVVQQVRYAHATRSEQDFWGIPNVRRHRSEDRLYVKAPVPAVFIKRLAGRRNLRPQPDQEWMEVEWQARSGMPGWWDPTGRGGDCYETSVPTSDIRYAKYENGYVYVIYELDNWR